MKKGTVFRPLACLLCLLLLFSCTSCAATMDDIFAGRNVDHRVNLSNLDVPDSISGYTGTTAFPNLNTDELMNICCGTKEVTEKRYVTSYEMHTDDGSQLIFAFKNKDNQFASTGEFSYPLEENALSVSFFRGDIAPSKNSSAHRTFFTRLYHDSMTAMQGKIGQVLAETIPADDPILVSSMETAESLMKSLGYSRYEMEYAYRYSMGALEELALQLSCDVDAIPDHPLYRIRYRFYPTGVEDALQHREFSVECMFDQDGLVFAYALPEPVVKKADSGKPITAKKAYSTAMEGTSFNNCILFDAQLVLNEFSKGQFRPAWVFVIATEGNAAMQKKWQKQIDAVGAKGIYDIQFIYVDALTGTKITGMPYQMPILKSTNCFITKYNTPKLF